MRKILNKKSGFTLIELMIVVAILGILAAIAIPAFVTYVRRSKTVEATENVNAMFNGIASYYGGRGETQSARGLNAVSQQHCTVDGDTNGMAAAPTDHKQDNTYTAGDGMTAIGFRVQQTYYLYRIGSADGAAVYGSSVCNNVAPASPAAAPTVSMTLQAFGDLDADGVQSLFEQFVANNSENELYRARGFYISNETE